MMVRATDSVTIPQLSGTNSHRGLRTGNQEHAGA